MPLHLNQPIILKIKIKTKWPLSTHNCPQTEWLFKIHKGKCRHSYYNIKIECAFCKIPFYKKRYRKDQYCSVSCAGRGSSEIIVPLLVGGSVKESKIILEQHNLKVGLIISEGEILDTMNAIVINQRPLSELTLQPGDMVDFVIKQFIDSLQSTDSIIIE